MTESFVADLRSRLRRDPDRSEQPEHRGRDRRIIIAVAALGLVALAVVWFRGRDEATSTVALEAPAAIEAESTTARGRDSGGGEASAGEIRVHVVGAVVSPGVYRFEPGARAEDALAAAGGPKPEADLTLVNLAAKVEDGQQILVRAAAAPGTAAAATAASPGAAPAGPVNLNAATAEELDTLPGVGPTTAAKIVSHREEHGPFREVDDLLDVPGIGDAKLAELRDLVTV